MVDSARRLRIYAERIDSSVARELDRAELLAARGFYTEAGLRLGRVIEASLYSIADELGVDLTNRSIEKLANLRDSLRQYEVQIMKRRTVDEVRQLANTSKRLSEAIVLLAQDELLRQGVRDEDPRPNEQLFRELLIKVVDDTVRQRLETNRELLRTIQNQRNTAAHAAVDGSERELDEADYGDLRGEVSLFVAALLDGIISERARRIWEPRAPEGQIA